MGPFQRKKLPIGEEDAYNEFLTQSKNGKNIFRTLQGD